MSKQLAFLLAVLVSLSCFGACSEIDDSGDDSNDTATRLGDPRERNTPNTDDTDPDNTDLDDSNADDTNPDDTDLPREEEPDSIADPTDTTDDSSLDDCAEEAKRIYLVDGATQSLLGFDPETGQFHTVSSLTCPSSFYTPHSMAVSRDAEAYILYQDSSIYRVNTQTGQCALTSFSPGFDFDWALFGMGYAMNSRDAAEDTLFIANASQLGAIDLTNFSIRPIGYLEEGMPELSGTAWGDLWGFFPQAQPPIIAQIDKTNGEFLIEYELSLSSDANAWAFAFWGGHFYLFYKTTFQDSTNVYRMPVEGGELELIAENTGYYIVGAGVSTCAPVKWPEDE